MVQSPWVVSCWEPKLTSTALSLADKLEVPTLYPHDFDIASCLTNVANSDNVPHNEGTEVSEVRTQH